MRFPREIIHINGKEYLGIVFADLRFYPTL